MRRPVRGIICALLWARRHRLAPEHARHAQDVGPPNRPWSIDNHRYARYLDSRKPSLEGRPDGAASAAKLPDRGKAGLGRCGVPDNEGSRRPDRMLPPDQAVAGDFRRCRAMGHALPGAERPHADRDSCPVGGPGRTVVRLRHREPVPARTADHLPPSRDIAVRGLGRGRAAGAMGVLLGEPPRPDGSLARFSPAHPVRGDRTVHRRQVGGRIDHCRYGGIPMMDPMVPFWLALAKARHNELLREAERERLARTLPGGDSVGLPSRRLILALREGSRAFREALRGARDVRKVSEQPCRDALPGSCMPCCCRPTLTTA